MAANHRGAANAAPQTIVDYAPEPSRVFAALSRLYAAPSGHAYAGDKGDLPSGQAFGGYAGAPQHFTGVAALAANPHTYRTQSELADGFDDSADPAMIAFALRSGRRQP